MSARLLLLPLAAVAGVSLLFGCSNPGVSSDLIAAGTIAGAAPGGAPSNMAPSASGAAGASSAGAAPIAGGGATSGGAGGATSEAGGGAGGGGAGGTVGGAGGVGGAGAPAPDHGDEYVWIDQDFHWDQGSDANVADTGPHDWYDDAGRNYHDGKIEFRVTVTAKADATPVWHELCHWQNSLGDAAHVCLHCLPLYTATGEYSCETTAAQQGGPVDYHQPFVAVQNRVKDGTSGRGMDLINLKKGLPIDYHYTVVLVPAGQTFSGWDSYPH